MLDQTAIDLYLEQVDRYLHVDGAHRRRVLDEIEGHLQDAVEAHVALGAQPYEAMQRAIAEVGPPADVAAQFTPTPSPSRAVRGWSRWTPMILPFAVFVGGATLTASNLFMLRHGLTKGLQLALRHSLQYTAMWGTLAAATYVAIQKGDRDPAWRRAAWLSAAITGVLVGLSIVG